MTRPKNAIELNYEDLVGGAVVTGTPAAETGAPAAIGGAETGGELLTTIDSMMERANAVITNLKDLISMVKGSGFGVAPGAQSQQAQIYQPQPTLAQQVHRIINLCYTAYGDISLTELIQGLVAQYGSLKLSAVLKALQGGQK
jgi:hypothetical protein